MKSEYTFRITIENIDWAVDLVYTGHDVEYDVEKEIGYMHMKVVVNEPSDFYIHMHNAKRQGIISLYQVETLENEEKS